MLTGLERRGAAVVDPLRIGEVALAVRDLGLVAGFYRGVLGLQVLDEAPGQVRLGAGGAAFLALLHRPDARPDNPAEAGLYHTAFLLPSRADLAAWAAHAGTLRTPISGASDHSVSEAIYLNDPEGNGVEVYADRPREAWRWSERQVEMSTRRLDIPGLLRDAAGPWAGAPAGTRVGHVHLRVGDVEEAARFYTAQLGLDVVRARAGAVFMSTGGYHHHIAANTWHSAGAGVRDPRRAGLAHITLDAADASVISGVPGVLRDPWGTELRVRVG